MSLIDTIVTALWMVLLAFFAWAATGCATLKNLGPEGCEALVVNAKDQAVRWTRAVDEDKAEEAAEYAYLVADLLAVGCVFVPPPSAPPVEIVP